MAFTDQFTDYFTNQIASHLGLDKADLYQRIQGFSLDTIDSVISMADKRGS